jgi:hypothetical protein
MRNGKTLISRGKTSFPPKEWVDTPNSKDDCQSRCPPSCQRNIYSAQVVKTKVMDCKQSEFHIYFSSGEMQVWENMFWRNHFQITGPDS